MPVTGGNVLSCHSWPTAPQTIHTGTEPFRCLECGQTFRWVSGLLRQLGNLGGRARSTPRAAQPPLRPWEPSVGVGPVGTTARQGGLPQRRSSASPARAQGLQQPPDGAPGQVGLRPAVGEASGTPSPHGITEPRLAPVDRCRGAPWPSSVSGLGDWLLVLTQRGGKKPSQSRGLGAASSGAPQSPEQLCGDCPPAKAMGGCAWPLKAAGGALWFRPRRTQPPP